MPCSTCDQLKKEYEDALARLRQSITEFERQSTPTLAQIDEVERDRQTMEQVRLALEKHLAQHVKL